MGKVTRKRYTAEFKAKVALDAIRGELTLAEPAAKHGIHQTMIVIWKKQAVESTRPSATCRGILNRSGIAWAPTPEKLGHDEQDDEQVFPGGSHPCGAASCLVPFVRRTTERMNRLAAARALVTIDPGVLGRTPIILGTCIPVHDVTCLRTFIQLGAESQPSLRAVARVEQWG